VERARAEPQVYGSKWVLSPEGARTFALSQSSPKCNMPVMKSILASLCLLFALSLVHVQAAPPSAEELLAQAGKKAEAEKKVIYVHFGASWCGWCKRHDAFLEQAAIKPVFEKYFVPVKVVVQESAQNKALENAGADELLKKVGGPSGLPFSAFLDAKGKLIVNSDRVADKKPVGNIGHPFAPEEIEWFVTMMKKSAPTMAAEDVQTIESALKAQKK